MVKYDGPDRRREQEDGKQGRRLADLHCPEHPYIQEQTKEHRAVVCGKITSLKAEVDKMVPWKVFAFLFTFSVLVGGAGFGFFGAHLDRLADKHDKQIDVVLDKLTAISSTQAAMSEQLVSIKQRQDVLRDAHMREMRQRDKVE